ncbi:hypothetical protein PshuTeo2_23790 [Pseudomonas hunanensis]|uniref:hypothetical protein n=1 Tax=Pseudomonas hunanensis TaxID=1247546 RepID=UPI002AA0D702|nr:hypothetical protein [Pseudomonas hunanensis]MDY7072270.1 hypothetical protein [Pseudomonas hunanensis]
MRAPLSGIEFSSTVWSHDGLAATEETAQVKAELLEDILQKYRTVLDRPIHENAGLACAGR